MYGLTPEILAQLSPYLRKRDNGQADILPINFGQATQPPPMSGIAFEPQAVAGMPVPAGEPIVLPREMMPPPAAGALAMDPMAVATRPQLAMEQPMPAVDLASVLPPPPMPEPLPPVARQTVPSTRMTEPPRQVQPEAGLPAAAPALSFSSLLAAMANEPEVMQEYQKATGAPVEVSLPGAAEGQEKKYNVRYFDATEDKPAYIEYVNPQGRKAIFNAETTSPLGQKLFTTARDKFVKEKEASQVIRQPEPGAEAVPQIKIDNTWQDFLGQSRPGFVRYRVTDPAAEDFGFEYEVPVTDPGISDFRQSKELVQTYESATLEPYKRAAAAFGGEGGTFTYTTEDGEPVELPSLESMSSYDYLGKPPVDTYRAGIKPTVTKSSAGLPTFGYAYDKDVPLDVQKRMNRVAADMNDVVAQEAEAITRSLNPTEKTAFDREIAALNNSIATLREEITQHEEVMANNLPSSDEYKEAKRLKKASERALAQAQAARIEAYGTGPGVRTTQIPGGGTAITSSLPPGTMTTTDVGLDWNTISSRIFTGSGGDKQQAFATTGEIVAPEIFAERMRDTELTRINAEEAGTDQVQYKIDKQDWGEFFSGMRNFIFDVQKYGEDMLGIDAEKMLDMNIAGTKKTLRQTLRDVENVVALADERLKDRAFTEQDARTINYRFGQAVAPLLNGTVRLTGEAETYKGGKPVAVDQSFVLEAEKPYALVSVVRRPTSGIQASKLETSRNIVTDTQRPPDLAATGPRSSQGKQPPTRYPYIPGLGNPGGNMASTQGATILGALTNLSGTAQDRSALIHNIFYSPAASRLAAEQGFAMHGRQAQLQQAIQAGKQNTADLNKLMSDLSPSNTAGAALRKEYYKLFHSLHDKSGMSWIESDDPNVSVGPDEFAKDCEDLAQGRMSFGDWAKKYRLTGYRTAFTYGGVTYPAGSLDVQTWMNSSYAKQLEKTYTDKLRFTPEDAKKATMAYGRQIWANMAALANFLYRLGSGTATNSDGQMDVNVYGKTHTVGWLDEEGMGGRSLLAIPATFEDSRSVQPLPAGQNDPNNDESKFRSSTDIGATSPFLNKLISAGAHHKFVEALVQYAPASVKARFTNLMRGMNEDATQGRSGLFGATGDQELHREYSPGNSEAAGMEYYYKVNVPAASLQFNPAGSIQNRWLKYPTGSVLP